MRKLIPILLLMPLAGCAAVQEIQENAQAILGGVVESFVGSNAGDKIVEAVVSPSVISVTEALLASVAVITGGVAGYVGVKRGKKARK
jgi:hypothetical protein